MSERQLSVRLRADAEKSPAVVKRAMFSAAQKARSFIVKQTPVDRGLMRVAWKVIRLSTGVELVNDQPYAGVMERGARPFKISQLGVWALKAWAMRKLRSGQIVVSGQMVRISWARGWKKRMRIAKGESLITRKVRKRISKTQIEKQAESIAYAVAKTFEKVGIRGRGFVLKNLPFLASMMDQEFVRSLSKFFNRTSLK